MIFIVTLGVKYYFSVRVKVRIRVTLGVNTVIFTAPMGVEVWAKCWI